MTLQELIDMTRFYCRDSHHLMFSDEDIIIYLNQAIDRIKQTNKIFKFLRHLVPVKRDNVYVDTVVVLPEHFHYMLALFAAHRCFDNDERTYESTQKRNEFEQCLAELIDGLESGNIELLSNGSGAGNILDDGDASIEYVTDIYFHEDGDYVRYEER